MNKDPLPELRGVRVVLRRPRDGDVEARRKLGRDPEIVRMYGGGPGNSSMTDAEADRWVQRLQNHGHAWVIDADGLIGSIRLDCIDMHDRRASMAVGIDNKERLNQGLGTEAIRLILGCAFDVLRLHRISIRVVAYNKRAIRAYEKCGFKVEGSEREAALVDGVRHDDIKMGILEREFRANGAGAATA
jgi:RimJ/RimL family protein N-acetyltransferase